MDQVWSPNPDQWPEASSSKPPDTWDRSQARAAKRQASSYKRQATSLTGPELWDNMGIMKNKLKQINDELLIFYNRPGMALHFQPTNLKVLKNLIARLVELEDECESKKHKK